MYLILFGLLGLTLACTSRPTVTGTYQLRTVNGERLPVRAGSHSRGSAQIVGGSVALNPGGTYKHRLLFRVGYDTITYADSAVNSGRYVPEGSTILLETPAGSMRSRLSQDVLVVDVEGWRYEYRRMREDTALHTRNRRSPEIEE